jgi:RecA-family ATPase
MNEVVQLLRPDNALRRVSYTAFADIDPNPTKKWLVDNFLGEGETSAEFGMPGTAKSVYALDLGAHVASGKEWFGRRVASGAVLYIAAERASVCKRRAAAWRHYHKVETVPFYIASESFDLRSSARDAEAIARCGEELEQISGKELRLIVIDTISRVLNGGDENSAKDMGTLVSNLGLIQEHTGAHVLVIHHIPHGQQRLRGHGSLLGGLDTTISMEKSQAGHVASLESLATA